MQQYLLSSARSKTDGPDTATALQKMDQDGQLSFARSCAEVLLMFATDARRHKQSLTLHRRSRGSTNEQKILGSLPELDRVARPH